MNLQGYTEPFPVFTISRGSYIVGMEIQSGINFDVPGGRHSIQIGQFCSIAENITLIVELNHDFQTVTTAASNLIKYKSVRSNSKRKGQILVQNDVWVGHGVTIMSGVTIHNGACIAANAHVVKDVPPYAIVGGNPAKVIKYRFTDEHIADLLNIAWWDWSNSELTKRSADFGLPVEKFIGKYRCSQFVHVEREKTRYVTLLFADFSEPYPVWQKIVSSWVAAFGHDGNAQLWMYVAGENCNAYIALLNSHLVSIGEADNDNIVVHLNIDREETLFQQVDFYVTTRAKETVRRTCLADKFGVKTISGVDDPIFHEN
jgi:virginiamycin A acetyltransferase